MDPGARVSMAGQTILQSLAKVAAKVGLMPTQEQLAKPMRFQGVGKGAPEAKWKVNVKRAVPCSDSTRIMDFKTPAVTGSGE